MDRYADRNTNLVLAVMLALLCASPALAQPDTWTSRRRDPGIHLRILRDYRLPAGDTTDEPVIVIGGSAAIDGRAGSDVIVVGGTARVGPDAVIRGDLVTVGGRAIVTPGARVNGDVDEISVLGPRFGGAWARLGGNWWEVAAFGVTLVRLFVAFVVSLLWTIVAPRWVHDLGARASSAGTSALLGLAGQVLFVPALAVVSIALIVSIVGIPLITAMPLLVAAAALVWAAGFTAVAGRAGRRLRGHDAPAAPFLDLCTGFTAISTLTLMAHAMTFGPYWLRSAAFTTGAAGLAVEYLAWTIGFGAVLSAVLGSRSPRTPPALRHAAAAPTAR